jgi:hypothetical protein
VATGRMRPPVRRRFRPGRPAPRAFAAPGREPIWALERPPKKSGKSEGCPPISSSYPSCGKTYRSD